MSGTLIVLQFCAVVEAHENLPPDVIERADETGETGDDVVRSRLVDVMAGAGQRFIDAHPELFRPGTGLV